MQQFYRNPVVFQTFLLSLPLNKWKFIDPWAPRKLSSGCHSIKKFCTIIFFSQRRLYHANKYKSAALKEIFLFFIPIVQVFWHRENITWCDVTFS